MRIKPNPNIVVAAIAAVLVWTVYASVSSIRWIGIVSPAIEQLRIEKIPNGLEPS